MKSQDLFSVHRTSKRLNESLQKVFGKKINLENFDLDQLQDARNKLRTQLSQIRGESGFNENLENDAFHQAQFMLDAINAEIAERDEHIIESDVEEDEMDPDGRIQAEIEKFLETNPKDGDDLQAFHHKAISDKNKELDDYLTFLYDYVADQTGAGGTEEAGVYDEMLDMLHQMMADKGWSEGVEEGKMSEIDIDLRSLANRGDEEDLIAALEGEMGPEVADVLQNMMDDLKDELASKGMNDVMRDEDKMIEILWDKIVDEYSGNDDYDDEGGETDDNYALASAGFGSDEDYGDFGRDESIQFEKAPPGAKAERMVKHIKKGYADDGKLTKKEKGIAYATAWKQHNKEKNESVDQGEDMTRLREGSAHAYNVVKWYNKNNDQPKLTKWLRTHAGLPKDAPLYFDDADLVYGEETIVPDALVDTKLKFNDLLDAVIDASGSEVPKFQKMPSTHYRRPGLEFGRGQGKEFGPWTKESVETGEDMTRLREGEVQQASAIVTAKTMVDRVGRWIEELSGMENETLLQLGDSIRDEMGQEQAKAFIEGVAPAIQQALENLKTTRDTLSTSVRSLASGEQPADMLGAEPAMGGEEEMGPVEPDAMNAGAEPTDDFAAAEPAAGGAEEAGREQRESIQYQHRLLKVLAG